MRSFLWSATQLIRGLLTVCLPLSVALGQSVSRMPGIEAPAPQAHAAQAAVPVPSNTLSSTVSPAMVSSSDPRLRLETTMTITMPSDTLINTTAVDKSSPNSTAIPSPNTPTPSVSAIPTAAPFAQGDVFIGADGVVNHYTHAGQFIGALQAAGMASVDTTGSSNEIASCFDGTRTLYTVNSSGETLSAFDNTGQVVAASWPPFGGSVVGIQYFYPNWPTDCVVDAHGDIFVATEGNQDWFSPVREIGPAGTTIGAVPFDIPIGAMQHSPPIYGVNDMDLGPDGCTLIYTPEVWGISVFGGPIAAQSTPQATDTPGPQDATATTAPPSPTGTLTPTATPTSAAVVPPTIPPSATASPTATSVPSNTPPATTLPTTAPSATPTHELLGPPPTPPASSVSATNTPILSTPLVTMVVVNAPPPHLMNIHATTTATPTHTLAFVVAKKQSISERHVRVMHLAIKIALPVVHRTIAGGSPLTVIARTRPRTGVTITVRFTRPTQGWIGQRRERHKTTLTQVLYQATTHTKADAKGSVRVSIRLDYNPTRAVEGTLTIVVQSVTGIGSQAMQLMITHGISREHKHPLLRRANGDVEIVALFGASEEGMIRQVMPDRWREGERAYLIEYERLHDEHARPFPGIIEALRTLREWGVRLAIVTGKGRKSADISIRRLGLAPYFERIEVGSPVGPIKPQGMRAVLAAWSVSPEECAYVGDTPYDIEAAADVGLLGLGAAWASTATVGKADDPRSAPIFADVNDMMAWIERNVELRRRQD